MQSVETPKSSGCSHSRNTIFTQTKLQMVKQTSTKRLPKMASSLNLPSAHGKPRGCALLRTGFGPQGLEWGARLHVLHGGLMKTASNSPSRIRRRRACTTSSLLRSCSSDRRISHSSIASSMPALVHKVCNAPFKLDFRSGPANKYKTASLRAPPFKMSSMLVEGPLNPRPPRPFPFLPPLVPF